MLLTIRRKIASLAHEGLCEHVATQVVSEFGGTGVPRCFIDTLELKQDKKLWSFIHSSPFKDVKLNEYNFSYETLKSE